MKTSYKGYYSLSSSELEDLWENGIFTFDANILLNLYRYSQSTSNELLQVIKKLKPRIWLSYQAGLEFHRNRLKIIKEQEESYQTLIDELDKDESKLINQLGSNRHPFITGSEEIIKQLKDLFKEIKSKLKKQSEDYLKLVKEDNILNGVTELFNKKVGRKYSEEELEKIFKEGEVRYEKKIPPGFEDSKEKEGGRKYGDLVIWYQIIEYAKENKKPIIFVTAEQKEDWWRKNKGEIIGPCPELIEELEAKASVPFHMYRVDPFLKYSQKYLKTLYLRLHEMHLDFFTC